MNDVLRPDADTDPDFVRQLAQRSGTDVSKCLQCGKCTAGCPVDAFYDLSVNQIMRLAREGQKDRLLSCRSIWLCAACLACTSRCPADIDPAGVMEVLRRMAREAGQCAAPDVKLFADAFLAVLAGRGRIYEIELMLRFNCGTGRLLSDAELGPAALASGKLHLRPPKTAGRGAVARIIERFKERPAP